MRHLTFTALALLLAACEGKTVVTEADCQRFAEHFETLMNGGPNASEADKSKQVASQMSPELVRRCLEEATVEELRCAEAATNMDQLRLCNDKKKKKE